MRIESPKASSTDVLVIGGGGAGLRAAIEARRHGVDVLLASKSRAGYGNNTAISNAVFNAATRWSVPKDNPEVHFRDTLMAGRFLNDQRLVEIVVRGAEQQVCDLESFGVKFIRRGEHFGIIGAPGHTYARGFAAKNNIGINITLPLRRYAAAKGVHFEEGVLITRLLKSNNAIVGAMGVNEKGEVLVFNAKSTILAAGGAGQIYLRTNNAAEATGDGYVLAYEAGVPLRDMEFVQWYPTTLGRYGQKIFGYEPLAATAGIWVKNSLGEDILQRHGIKDPRLMTRDMLARAIMLEIAEGRGIGEAVVVDLTKIPAERLERVRHFLTKEAEQKMALPVSPTAHFLMGGVQINPACETCLEGLYAAGEACGGVHGANRLAGNAITEILVLGTVAGAEAAQRALQVQRLPVEPTQVSAEVERLRSLSSLRGREKVAEVRQLLKKLMWHKVGILRSGQSLSEALFDIQGLCEQLGRSSVGSYRELIGVLRLGNMLTVAEMVCRSALERRETRGAHYRSDYPEEDNKDWLRNIVIRHERGQMKLSTAAVDLVKMTS